MRHPVCDAFWDVAALRGWKGHGEGGQGGKRRHFDGDSKIFPLFFCRPLRPLCAAAVVWRAAVIHLLVHVRGAKKKKDGIFWLWGGCGAYEKDLGRERGGGGVFQSRVINHWLGSKKNYDRFRTTYGFSAHPPYSYKHKHRTFIHKTKKFRWWDTQWTQPEWAHDGIRQKMYKKWVWLSENCKNEQADTQKHTGRLVWQGHMSPTFPVLVNFCLFVVVVTSAPSTNKLCQAKYQRHIFLICSFHLDEQKKVNFGFFILLNMNH